MLYIISFDIAIKSLAVAIFKINDKWKTELQLEQEKLKLANLSTIQPILENIGLIYDSIIVPIYLDVIDLIPNQKIKETTTELRSARLKTFLNLLDDIIKEKINNLDDNKFKILLEYQMGSNDLSRNICSQILFYYSQLDYGFSCANRHQYADIDTDISADISADADVDISKKYSVEIIGPSLKNKINFKYNHTEFVKKYSNNYNANKAHSKCNFLYWINYTQNQHLIGNIKKKNLDDIADATNMAIAWLYLKSDIVNHH
jgi:hypothetical protein